MSERQTSRRSPPPPHDLEAEGAVLSAILISEAAFERVRGILRAEHFYSDPNRFIYGAVDHLTTEGTAVDLVSVASWLRDRKRLSAIGGPGYLAQLVDESPAVSHVEAHVETVIEKWRLRQLIATCQRIAAEGYEPSGSAAELISSAQRSIESLSRGSTRDTLDVRPTVEIFAPLAPRAYPVQGFALCAGPPTLWLAYAFGGKSVMLQDLALAVSMGEKIWHHFNCEEGRVLHIDYEQGREETFDRYQRLARGRRLDFRDIVAAGRLEVVSLPPIHLNSPTAADAYKRACDGRVLAFIDTLGASLPGEDENDGNIRRWLDALTPVSLATGCIFILAHHMAKIALSDVGRRADLRTLAKGNNAIFNAAGYAYVCGGAKGEPKLVQQAKARGLGDPPVEDFYLELSTVDVRAPEYEAGWEGYYNRNHPSDPGGFEVRYKTVEQVKPPKPPREETLDSDCDALLEFFRSENRRGRGVGSATAACRGAGLRKVDGLAAFETLRARKAIENRGRRGDADWWAKS